MAKVGCQVLILVRYVLRHLRQKIERLENLEVSVDFWQRRDRLPVREGSVSTESAVGNYCVTMRIKINQRSETLYRSDHSGHDILVAKNRLIDILDRLPCDATKLAQQRPVVLEIQPEPLWNREDKLSMRDVFENFLSQMLRKDKDTFLVE